MEDLKFKNWGEMSMSIRYVVGGSLPVVDGAYIRNGRGTQYWCADSYYLYVYALYIVGSTIIRLFFIFMHVSYTRCTSTYNIFQLW